MQNRSSIPQGIAQNNPGWLRSGYGADSKTRMHMGLAQFDSMEDGCHALACLTWDYYHVHGLQTLPSFVGRFANGCDHDHIAYIKRMAVLLNHNMLIVSQQNLYLGDAWNALLLMRALVITENGFPLPGQSHTADWINPLTWVNAMQRTGKWR